MKSKKTAGPQIILVELFAILAMFFTPTILSWPGTAFATYRRLKSQTVLHPNPKKFLVAGIIGILIPAWVVLACICSDQPKWLLFTFGALFYLYLGIRVCNNLPFISSKAIPPPQ